MAQATESSGYVCLRNPCDPSWFAACPCEVGIELDNMLVPFYWGSLYIICTFVHSLILKYPLFRHNCLIYTHIRTYRRTNTRPEYIYWVYSRRSTTFVFRCSLKSWFLTIFDIFSRDRQTDRPTDRPTRVGMLWTRSFKKQEKYISVQIIWWHVMWKCQFVHSELAAIASEIVTTRTKTFSAVQV